MAATLFFDVPPAPADATVSSSRLPRTLEFLPDFSRGEERGIGLRFKNVVSGHYVDLRLGGFRGTNARQRGSTAEFDASSRVKVVYETHGDLVKETIISQDPSLTDFRFQISTSGLERRTEDGRIVFAPEGQPAMFRLGELVTFDSAGVSIPGTLTAEDDRLLIRLEKTSLQRAVLPVMIDPTIEGVAAGSTSGAQGRRIVELRDATLAFFFRHLSPDGPKVVYRLSEDKGETWGTTKTVGDGGPSSDISVVHTQEDDVLIAYSAGTQELPRISYRELERTEDGFDIGLERIVTTANVWWRPIPTLIERSQGPLGRSVAVGFRQWSPVANRFEYAVASSDNSGISWVPTTCATTTGVGTIAKEGSRLLCIPVTAQNASFKELGPAGWGPATTIISNTLLVGDAPSHIHTDDGRLHLVFTNSGSVYYTQMTPGATSFTGGRTLGPGQNPVITTNGTSLYVHAMWLHNSSESRITSYVATDGQNFNQGKPLGGDTFDYVLDKNESWDFKDEAGDGLFGLVSGTAMVGNQIGSSSVGHLIDDMSEKLSFSFVASSAATITSVDLWTTNTATGSLTYVIGIKPDAGGVPGDEWVEGKQNGVTVPGNSPRQMPAEQRFDFESMSVPLPEIPLLENTRYHLVIEPLSGVSALSNASFQAVGTAPGATQNYKVLDHSSSWALSSNEVPRFKLSGPAGVVVEQLLAPGTSYPVLDYQGAGQKFTASQAITPTDLRLHFAKVGNPTTTVKAKLLDSSLATMWESSSFTPAVGWATVTVASGPALSSGSTYRLVLESDNRDLNNYWQLTTSGDATASWLGTSSTFSRWLDRPGTIERTPEASDMRSGAWDFWAFNTSATDTLLVGDDKPFDFVILNRQAGPYAGSNFSPTYKYWNGSSWATLAMERDQLGTTYESSEFDPPADWATTTVDGKAAYWVEVKANSKANVLVERVTAIRNLRDPSVAQRVNDYGPLAMADLNGTPSSEILQYDVIPPSIRNTLPIPGGQTSSVTQTLAVAFQTDSPIRAVNLNLDSEVIHQEEFQQNLFFGTPATITVGPHLATVTAVDNAGNALLPLSWIFHVVNVDVSPAPLEIEAESIVPNLFLPGEVLTFQAPLLHMGSADVRLSGNRHPGFGAINRRIDMSGLVARFPSTSHPPFVEVPVTGLEALWTSTQFTGLHTSGDTLGLMSLPKVIQLSSISVEIPDEASPGATAYLVESSEVWEATPIENCVALPTASGIRDCDPLPNLIPFDEATKIVSDINNKSASHVGLGDTLLSVRVSTEILDAGGHPVSAFDEDSLGDSPVINFTPNHSWSPGNHGMLYRQVNLWGFRGSESKVVADSYFRWIDVTASEGEMQTTIGAGETWTFGSSGHQIWDASGLDVSSELGEDGLPLVATQSAQNSAAVGWTINRRTSAGLIVEKGWLSSTAYRETPPNDCPLCPTIRTAFATRVTAFTDAPQLRTNGYYEPQGSSVTMLPPLSLVPHRPLGEKWASWRTLFLFENPPSLSELNDVLGGIPNLHVTKLAHVDSRGTGQWTGRTHLSQASDIYSEGYARGLAIDGLPSATTNPCVIELEGTVAPSILGELAGDVRQRIEIGPGFFLGLDDTCRPILDSGSMHSGPEDDIFKRVGIDVELPWWPNQGEVWISTTSCESNVLCRHISQDVTWPDERAQNMERYEHTFNQVRPENNDSKITCPENQTKAFWAYREGKFTFNDTTTGAHGYGQYLEHNFGNAGADWDTRANDNCRRHNLTIRVKFPALLVAHHEYWMRMDMANGSAEKSTFAFGPEREDPEKDFIPIYNANDGWMGDNAQAPDCKGFSWTVTGSSLKDRRFTRTMHTGATCPADK